MALLKLLKTYWLPLFCGLAAMGAGYALAALVYGKQLADDAVSFSNAKNAWQVEKTQAAKDATAALVAAQAREKAAQQRAATVSAQLLANIDTLTRANQALKRQIHDATQQDGATYTGVGPNSLCLYQSALGYPDCDQRVPAASRGATPLATETAPTSGGLPPGDLLAHAADYGKWCQQLETQLRQLKAYYAGGTQ